MAKCCRCSRFLFYKRKKKRFYVLNDPPKHDDLANVFWRWNKSLLWALCLLAVKERWTARVVVIRRSPAGCTGTGSGARSVNPNLPLSPPPTSAADFKSSLHSNQHRPHQKDKLPQREIVGLECHSPIRCLANLFLSFSLSLCSSAPNVITHARAPHTPARQTAPRSANKRQPNPRRARWCIISCGGRR